ncbi:MAG: universal stress protein [Candidatus Obscuribacterales bacterium]|nr:universal stress protein [Candidatus Obscuribacterales bacterium]
MKIIIAVDDSEFSQTTIDSVAKRTWPELSEFLLVSVAQPLMTDLGGMVLEVDKQYCQDLIERLTKSLEAKLPQYKISGQIVEGQAADEIIRIAEQWQADLIIVGSHGRRGLNRLVLGSVAESIVNKSRCSVEVIKRPLESVSYI